MTISSLAVALPHAEPVFAECPHPVTWRYLLRTVHLNASGTVIPAQFPIPFCDDAVTPEVLTALEQSAELIRRLGQQQTEAILAIGRELIAVKELLPFDLLGPWIRKEFGMADETASGYTAATREIPADPPKKSPRPNLISWDREGQNGARGYADIELPCGVIIYHCPVFSGAQDGPYVEPSFPSHVDWPKAFFSDEFDDDILSQIREVDPGAFDEDRCRLRTETQSKGPA
jgi:hypothetical protein